MTARALPCKGRLCVSLEDCCNGCVQADPRDPHPCPTCGVTLVYDGWDSVHVEGPQRNYGADNCALAAARDAAS